MAKIWPLDPHISRKNENFKNSCIQMKELCQIMTYTSFPEAIEVEIYNFSQIANWKKTISLYIWNPYIFAKPAQLRFFKISLLPFSLQCSLFYVSSSLVHVYILIYFGNIKVYLCEIVLLLYFIYIHIVFINDTKLRR